MRAHFLTVGLLVLSVAAGAGAAQKPARDAGKPVDQAEIQAGQQKQNPALDPQTSAEVDRELAKIKQQLVREAMWRMQAGTSRREDRGLEQVLLFLVFTTILGSLLWLVRLVADNRRWSRIAKIQTDVHMKLLERMSSSQELLAYMDTEAGRRFLESTPFELERPQSAAFPYARILWSAQAGVVALILGLGLLWLPGRLPQASEGLLVFGALALALGIGLILSAGLAYLLSKSFGLLEKPAKAE